MTGGDQERVRRLEREAAALRRRLDQLLAERRGRSLLRRVAVPVSVAAGIVAFITIVVPLWHPRRT